MEIILVAVAALLGVAALGLLGALVARRGRRQAEQAELVMEARFRKIAEQVARANSDNFMALTRATLANLQDNAAAQFSSQTERQKAELEKREQAMDAIWSQRQAAIDALLQREQQSIGALLEKRHVELTGILAPLQDNLSKVQARLVDIEVARVGAYEGIKEQINNLAQTHVQLRQETANLSRALRNPTSRGRWGEIQLKRVVEMAGMLSHCDFVEQQVRTVEGTIQRPDMVVRLPGGRTIVVDAKAPLSAYLESVEATAEEVRLVKLKAHADSLRGHIKSLSEKAYWDQFSGETPDFVILFLPGDPFFGAALEQDPTLIEQGVTQKVMLATPTTLIALLRAVAFGWRQEALADNAKKIAALGNEMTARLATFLGHFSDVGRSLNGAVGAYNKAASSLESRVLATARKFQALEGIESAEEELVCPPPLEVIGREITGATTK